MRLKDITEAEFRALLSAKKIRPASLEDVNGTHHRRPLYKHPRTSQYYVEV
jgi:hypothetical protein